MTDLRKMLKQHFNIFRLDRAAIRSISQISKVLLYDTFKEFDISELPVFLLLNISKTVADIFLIFYIWIHIDDMH